MERLRSGGHDVPYEIVPGRYRNGWRNFEEIYRDLVDEWTVYDNSGSQPVILASGVKG